MPAESVGARAAGGRRRFALGVEYDGRGFLGWERQRQEPTLQGCLERALSRVADEAVTTVCAGRTDAGVHAAQQVVHFDTGARRSPRSWLHGANANLPAGVSVTWVRAVAPDFHARRSARGRRYRYLLLNRSVRPGLLHARVGWEYRPLDAARMQEGGHYLLGEHDFSALRAAGCQARSPVRTVHWVEVERRGELIVFDVCANAFLQHMVRNIVGTLIIVGRAEREPGWVAEVLAGRDRRRAGPTVASGGLYLLDVEYPPAHGIPRVSPSPPLW